MRYTDEQIKITIDYIVKQLQIKGDKLTPLPSTLKDLASAELHNIIEPLTSSRSKCILVHRNNAKFDKFFEFLKNNNILFPEDSVFTLYENGDSLHNTSSTPMSIYRKPHEAKPKIHIDSLSTDTDIDKSTSDSSDDEYFQEKPRTRLSAFTLADYMPTIGDTPSSTTSSHRLKRR